MIKKLIVTGATAALLLSSAAGAFASFDPFHFGSSANIDISNSGSISNTVNTSANTGYNSQSAKGDVSGVGISTGAANAGANVMNQLNWNQLDCGCSLGLSSDLHKLDFDLTNSGSVSNTVNTSANTGFNSQASTGGSWWHSGSLSNSSITTGAAGASSVIQNVVNTNMFGTSSH